MSSSNQISQKNHIKLLPAPIQCHQTSKIIIKKIVEREIRHSHPSCRNLKMRGIGLPSCGTGVTEPTSTKPKPIPSKPSTASAFLSKPAERPIGFENFLPQTSNPKIGGSGLFSLGTEPRAAAETASVWATSASKTLRHYHDITSALLRY